MSVALWRPRRLFGLVVLASLGLCVYPLIHPLLVQDDFQILGASATWQRTWDGLWRPQNEHAMPLGRLLTFVIMRFTPTTGLPWAAGAVGPLALLAALPLLYLFVTRELGYRFYGLIATALFGVSSVYQQAVYWFAASYSVIVLDVLLLGLLAAQRWRQGGSAAWLVLAALACFVAPCWFASGVLVGPLCCLYLFCGRTNDTQPARSPGPPSLAPLAGTVIFLMVSIPLTAEHILHLKHYGGRTALQAFRPLTGLGYTCRSVVDNLLLGTVGFGGFEVPVPLVAVVLLALIGAVAWWWRQAPDGRLVILGLGLIVGGYLLVYSARALNSYEGQMTKPNWSRYHLLPQLGLALLVCGGLPGRKGGWFVLESGGDLTTRQSRLLVLLVVVLFLVQLPRALAGAWVCPPGLENLLDRPSDPAILRDQHTSLTLIAEVDRRCRERQIGADTVVKTLPPLPVPGWFDQPNGWELLRGSDNPRPTTAEEVWGLIRDLIPTTEN